VAPFTQPSNVRQASVYLVLTTAIILAVFKVVWSIDEHFISRAEFTAAIERIEGEMHALRPRVTP